MQEAIIDQPAHDITFRSVFGSTWQLVVRHPLGLALGSIGMAAIDSAFDMLAPEANANLITTFVSVGVVYAVFRHLLQKEGLIESEGGFGAYFGASMLSGLGVILGLILFIVPGLYLMARWSLASAMVLTRRMKAIEGLRASWQATSGCVWKLVLLYVGVFLAYLLLCLMAGVAAAVIAMATLGSANAIETSPFFVVALNLLVNLGVVGTAYLSVAVFVHVVGNDRPLESVFA